MEASQRCLGDFQYTNSHDSDMYINTISIKFIYIQKWFQTNFEIFTKLHSAHTWQELVMFT